MSQEWYPILARPSQRVMADKELRDIRARQTRPSQDFRHDRCLRRPHLIGILLHSSTSRGRSRTYCGDDRRSRKAG